MLWIRLGLDLNFCGDTMMSSMLMSNFVVENRLPNAANDCFRNFNVSNESCFQLRLSYSTDRTNHDEMDKLMLLLFLKMTRVSPVVTHLTY